MAELDVQAIVEDAAARFDVVGASVAVLHDGATTTGVTGVLNVRTGVAVTPDALFQIGSITKVWTATMVMQHVEAGTLELDAPVQKYLPDWRVADPDVSEAVTLRHLLTHTSGIEGDHFHDTGRGDDCLERYAASCATLGQTHALGETLSYCNTGYSVLGRILEVLEDEVWDKVLQRRLIRPLGLEHTVTLPEEALLHAAAVGHLAFPNVDPFVAPMWTLQRSAGPAGLICASAADLVTFARLHLDNGLARKHQLLASELVEAMQQPQAEVPDPHTLSASHWGLGWFLPTWDGRPLYGHDGGTLGQSAQLRILPDAGIAVGIVMNGGLGSAAFAREVHSAVFDALAGVRPPAKPSPADPPPDVDLDRLVGTYERLSSRIEVERAEDQPGMLRLTQTMTGELAEQLGPPPQSFDLRPVDEHGLFVASSPGSPEPVTAVFYGDRDGAPRFLHVGARANPRVT